VGLLRAQGYRFVRLYPGGMEEWVRGGHEVETGAPAATRRTARVVSPRPGRRRRWGAAMVDALERFSTGRILAVWAGMIGLCALIYWLAGWLPGHGLLAAGRPVGPGLRELPTAVYFSLVTATSVGYGDVVPQGAIRIVAVVEATLGLLLFGVLISKLVSRRQEQLVQEIHLLSFEERLDRVQINLHLVLADLQSIAALCDAGGIAAPRLAARLESAALVFTGELRAIHDLLYRPQQEPDEQVLEGILAGLAAAFRELCDLLACFDTGGRSSSLQANLGHLSRLAHEICGACVPRAYAADLRGWMDQIQGLARRLVA
jgi:hypothetical protein